MISTPIEMSTARCSTLRTPFAISARRLADLFARHPPRARPTREAARAAGTARSRASSDPRRASLRAVETLSTASTPICRTTSVAGSAIAIVTRTTASAADSEGRLSFATIRSCSGCARTASTSAQVSDGTNGLTRCQHSQPTTTLAPASTSTSRRSRVSHSSFLRLAMGAPVASRWLQKASYDAIHMPAARLRASWAATGTARYRSEPAPVDAFDASSGRAGRPARRRSRL